MDKNFRQGRTQKYNKFKTSLYAISNWRPNFPQARYVVFVILKREAFRLFQKRLNNLKNSLKILSKTHLQDIELA